MTSYEWIVNFDVDGLLPLKFRRKKIDDGLTFYGPKGRETRTVLSVKVFRQCVPSRKEQEEVRKIALQKATRLVNIYSLIIGGLKLGSASVDQVTPYRGARLVSLEIPMSLELAIPKESWNKKIKAIKKIQQRSITKEVSLALSHYNLALWSNERKSSFLNLMICMEALYNDSAIEIKYRISHRVASLFGRHEKMRQRIFNDIKELYKKRNDLVHGLKSVQIREEDKRLLGAYVKHSIMAFLQLKEKKKSVLEKIDKAIYDDGLRLEIQKQIEDIPESLEENLANI